jgi:hypothetical protein
MVVKALFVLGLNMQFKRGNYNGNFWHHVCTTERKGLEWWFPGPSTKQRRGASDVGVKNLDGWGV